jgi:NADPH-dependent 2,4-dienoyl-CoA reductase/sulfur reductase-like enzyme/ferredoxin
LTVANSHCTPCVGCTKNCYDFNPKVANLADMYDDNPYFSNYRRFFMGAFPGFILAFVLVPNPPSISILAIYGQFLVYMLVSVGSFFILDSFIKVTSIKFTTLYAAAALNIFYWFVFPGWFNALFGVATPVALLWLVRVALLAVSLWWVVRSYRKEPIFVEQLMPPTETHVSARVTSALRRAASREDQTEVTFMLPEERHFATVLGRSVLEMAERNDLPIEPGCRMGVCGADPIVILQGMDNLSEMKAEERSTLERLGLGRNCRMACMARINGPVIATLDLSQAEAAMVDDGDFHYDEKVKHVVIVGNGIAGVTAADYVRRYHPDCEINLIGKESHHLYNRMAISRLIYGRSAMSGLYLQPEEWYEKQKIHTWLNTLVAQVDPKEKRVKLATGECLPYDRLILTTGSSSFVPPIGGFGLPGTFVLREAEDAIRLRAFAQQHRAQYAVVSGGGLLGLEAAYALYKIGLDVTVFERGPYLLRRQLDERGGDYLRRYLESLGLHIVVQAECMEITGNGRVTEAILQDGRSYRCDILLVAVGIRSNLELAQDLGLAGKRGIVVNEQMQTSLPDVYAAGDVCEFEGEVMGLWTVAVQQAKVAAINAAGGQQRYEKIVPVTALKVVGVDLTSIGRFQPQSADEIEIALEESGENRYRKLLVADGKIVGAILLGYPLDAPNVTQAIKEGVDVTPYLEALQAGNWSVLGDLD